MLKGKSELLILGDKKDNKFKEENIICNNEINLTLEEIKNLKNEVTILKEQNEKYVKEIINKDELINKLTDSFISSNSFCKIL